MNATVYVVSFGIFAIFMNFVSVLFIGHQNRTKHQHSLIEMLLLVIFWTLATFFETWSYISPNLIISQTVIFTYIFLMYATMYFIDSITRETVDPMKVFIATILACICIVFTINPNNYYFTQIIPLKPILLIPFLVLNIYTGLLLFIYIIRLLIKSPNSFRKASGVLTFGIFLATIFSSISTLFIDNFIPSVSSGPAKYWFIHRRDSLDSFPENG